MVANLLHTPIYDELILVITEYVSETLCTAVVRKQESVSGGFTPSQHLRSYSGQEHTVFIVIQSDEHDDKKKKERNDRK